MEHEEYTAETYPSFGKKYNGEKAIISLTSWKARINTVSKTIFSILQHCQGFHVVLVLSEEEFPKMIDELPDDLMLFVKNNLIEILWVYKNYKSFKKVLFTMDKYRDVPVISADDDCVYICNYAEELYQEWLKNKDYVITNNGNTYKNFYWSQGPNTLFPPDSFNFKIIKKHLNKKELIEINNDDAYYGILFKLFKINMIQLKKQNYFYFHDEILPSFNIRKAKGGFQKQLIEINNLII